jgi:hypothetical protein
MTELKEEEMKGIVKEYFADLGFVGFEEIRIHQKRIDLYFVHRSYPKTIAVELKIRKWKQALRQAYQNSFYAQKSYVGLWHEFLTDEAVTEIESYGLGILEIRSDNVRLIAAPNGRACGILPSTWKIMDVLVSNNDHAFLWKASQ